MHRGPGCDLVWVVQTQGPLQRAGAQAGLWIKLVGMRLGKGLARGYRACKPSSQDLRQAVRLRIHAQSNYHCPSLYKEKDG